MCTLEMLDPPLIDRQFNFYSGELGFRKDIRNNSWKTGLIVDMDNFHIYTFSYPSPSYLWDLLDRKYIFLQSGGGVPNIFGKDVKRKHNEFALVM